MTGVEEVDSHVADGDDFALTCRLVLGDPVPDKHVVYWNVISWLFATALAAIFLGKGQLGPYKGLYCCVKETRYRGYAVAPILIVTFSAVLSMAYFYYQSYKSIKNSEEKRAKSSGKLWLPAPQRNPTALYLPLI